VAMWIAPFLMSADQICFGTIWFQQYYRFSAMSSSNFWFSTK